VVMQDVSTKALAETIASGLKRFGRFASDHPIYLEAPAGIEVIPAMDLLDKGFLRSASERAILEWTTSPSEEDVRAALSRLWRRYCDSLGMAVVLPLANGVALDFAFARCSFVMGSYMPYGVVVDLRGAELFTCEERPTTWPVNGTKLRTLAELRARVQRNVLSEHVDVAIDHVLEFVKVSPRMLWATMAEAIDLAYDGGVDHHTPEEYAPIREDHRAMFFDETLPGIDGPNPLAGQLEWESIPGFKRPQQVRKVCCFNYVVPGRPEPYCRTCGIISRDERLMIWGRYARDPKARDMLVDPPSGPRAR
jgi:hypothetical protein